MNQINSLILEGNAVKDIEVIEPMAGFKVGKFTLGVSRWYKNRNDEGVEDISYFDCECYGRAAEVFKDKIIKGRGVRVVGRLKQERWENADGKSSSRVFIVCEHVELLPHKKEEEKKEVE